MTVKTRSEVRKLILRAPERACRTEHEDLKTRRSSGIRASGRPNTRAYPLHGAPVVLECGHHVVPDPIEHKNGPAGKPAGPLLTPARKRAGVVGS
jgi:hypothetical protein